MARYLSEVQPVELVVPVTQVESGLDSAPRHKLIDDEILDGLRTLGLMPSPAADDAVFVGRVTLDLTGRLPSTDRVEAFLASNAASKRPFEPGS